MLKCLMVWSSSAQGIRPYAPPTRQTVCKPVTPSPRKPVFCSFCFQSLAHSFVGAHSTTPLQSYSSALFAQNTGGRYIPHNLLRVFKHLQTLRLSTEGYTHPPRFCPPPNLLSVPLCLCRYPVFLRTSAYFAAIAFQEKYFSCARRLRSRRDSRYFPSPSTRASASPSASRSS